MFHTVNLKVVVNPITGLLTATISNKGDKFKKVRQISASGNSLRVIYDQLWKSCSALDKENPFGENLHSYVFDSIKVDTDALNERIVEERYTGHHKNNFDYYNSKINNINANLPNGSLFAFNMFYHDEPNTTNTLYDNYFACLIPDEQSPIYFSLHKRHGVEGIKRRAIKLVSESFCMPVAELPALSTTNELTDKEKRFLDILFKGGIWE